MRPVILLLAATAIVAAAPPPDAAPYEAGGFEPFWTLVIEGGRLTFNPGTSEAVIRVREPRRQPIRNGYRYVVSPQLTIEVRHVRCNSYAGRTFADTVYVSGVAEGGCGGRPIAPARLNVSGWTVGAINGRPYTGDEVHLLFAWDNVVRGSAGCSDFSVPYTEGRGTVRFGRMQVMRRDCAGLGLERERRALAIFSGTSRISFVDGDTLILTGRHGTARLLP